MDKWFPVGLFRCVQYCCYLLFYIIRQVCDTPWIHCKAVLLVNLSMLCRLDDLSDWKDKCKFLCSYSLAMAGWRRGPTKEKERITSPLLHQPKSMLWFWHIKGIALPFLYINLISMHQSIWSFNIPLLDNPRAFKLSKIGLFKFPHPSTRENCVQSSTEVPHLTVKLFFVKGTISNSDFLVNLPFKAICLPSTSILKDQIPPPPPSTSTAGMDNSPMPVGCRWEGRGGMLISFTQIDWCIILSLFATQYLWYLWCKFWEFSMDQFLLPSAVCLILYWYSETKFCLGYSWEFKD